MSRLAFAMLLALALPPSFLAAEEAAVTARRPVHPPQPPTPDGRANSGDALVMQTETGSLRWTPGTPDIEILARDGRLLHRFPLARPDRRPPKSGDVSLRAMLPPRGSRFLVIEETHKAVGLHLHERKGDKKPKALVVRSLVRLVDESSRVLWERPTEDKTAVGEQSDSQHLQIAPDGTVALLLQDVDPYTKNRPVLTVINPGGREILRLDYTSWTYVEEFALSQDGRSLVVHGFGLVPEDEDMSRAIGFYRLGKKGPRWIKALARKPSPRHRLEVIDAKGWTCCVDTANGWLAFDDAGAGKTMSADEMWRKFGVKP